MTEYFLTQKGIRRSESGRRKPPALGSDSDIIDFLWSFGPATFQTMHNSFSKIGMDGSTLRQKLSRLYEAGYIDQQEPLRAY